VPAEVDELSPPLLPSKVGWLRWGGEGGAAGPGLGRKAGGTRRKADKSSATGSYRSAQLRRWAKCSEVDGLARGASGWLEQGFFFGRGRPTGAPLRFLPWRREITVIREVFPGLEPLVGPSEQSRRTRRQGLGLLTALFRAARAGVSGRCG